MIYQRYKDSGKLITDVHELELTQNAQVLIYREDQWYDEVFVDLEGRAERFEKLKPHIVFVAENLSKMDAIAQKYSELHGNRSFADGFEVAYILLDAPDRIRLGYYGMRENTEFEVIFQRIDDALILKSFGMVKDIPVDWDKGETQYTQ